ncbi:MAG: hypothetical protein E7638_02550 [Ruminococcaceae bacterium]|nr:hypothetical protein [Oscillospiraceae bacterium]
MGFLPNGNGDEHIRSRIRENEIDMRESFGDRFKGWRLGFSVEWDSILKGIVCGVLVVLFSLLQTTIFTKFKPFGAVPDLILPLVVAISMTEREKWGAIVGIAAAFVIESLGGSSVTLLPLLYMPAGYICGILTVHYLRDSVAVRAVYTLVSQAARVIITAIILAATVGDINIIDMLTITLIPEFFAGVIFAPLPHIAAKLCLRSFNKTREERVGTTRS